MSVYTEPPCRNVFGMNKRNEDFKQKRDIWGLVTQCTFFNLSFYEKSFFDVESFAKKPKPLEWLIVASREYYFLEKGIFDLLHLPVSVMLYNPVFVEDGKFI